MVRLLLNNPSENWGESGGGSGGNMKRIPLIGNVFESDLDMRVIERLHPGRVRRLFGSIFGNPQNLGAIDKPRRSIDRELQEYSPSYD